jgi:hypothetical protein
MSISSAPESFDNSAEEMTPIAADMCSNSFIPVAMLSAMVEKGWNLVNDMHIQRVPIDYQRTWKM